MVIIDNITSFDNSATLIKIVHSTHQLNKTMPNSTPRVYFCGLVELDKNFTLNFQLG